MSIEFVTKELYGGAITAQLPPNVIDASHLRQIPDHQEVFLSSKTLTSIIFEINEYQHDGTVGNTTGSAEGNLPSDEAAAAYHFNDLIEEPDHVSSAGIQTTPISLSQPSMSRYRAYRSSGTIISLEPDKFAKSALPGSWQTSPPQKEYPVETLQLLIRLQDYGTDLCVRISVPLKELGSGEAEAAQSETTHASAVMQKITESIDIKDFGLFGAEE